MRWASPRSVSSKLGLVDEVLPGAARRRAPRSAGDGGRAQGSARAAPRPSSQQLAGRSCSSSATRGCAASGVYPRARLSAPRAVRSRHGCRCGASMRLLGRGCRAATVRRRLCVALSGGLDSDGAARRRWRSCARRGSRLRAARRARRSSAACRLRAAGRARCARAARGCTACRSTRSGCTCDRGRGRVPGGGGPRGALRGARRRGSRRARCCSRRITRTTSSRPSCCSGCAAAGCARLAGMPRGRAASARRLARCGRCSSSRATSSHAWAGERGPRAGSEDPSNLDPRFDRNYLRLEVLPLLRQRWPAAAATAGRGRRARRPRRCACSRPRRALPTWPRVADGAALARRARCGAARADGSAPCCAPGSPGAAAARRPRAPARALRRDMLDAARDRCRWSRWPGARAASLPRRLHAAAARAAAPSERRLADGTGRASRCAARTGRRHARLVPRRRRWTQSRAPAGDAATCAARAAARRSGRRGGAHRRPLRKWLQERGVLPWRRERAAARCSRGESSRSAIVADARGRGGPASLVPVAWHGRADRWPSIGARTAADSASTRAARARICEWPAHAAIPLDCAPVVLLMRR